MPELHTALQLHAYCGVTSACAARYLENVPSIVPLLEKEYRNAARRLEDTQDELTDLHPDKRAPACSCLSRGFGLGFRGQHGAAAGGHAGRAHGPARDKRALARSRLGWGFGDRA